MSIFGSGELKTKPNLNENMLPLYMYLIGGSNWPSGLYDRASMTLQCMYYCCEMILVCVDNVHVIQMEMVHTKYGPKFEN